MQTPTLHGPGEGEHFNFLGNRNIVRAGGKETDGGMTVIEFTGAAGFGPPPHIHRREDEMFYVLEGTAEFWCDGTSATYEAGGFAFLPKGLPHRFECGAEGARILQITTPAQFEDMVADYGHRIGADEEVAPEAPDVPRLIEVCARYDIDLLLD
ncbi:cupin domain-containing protein [Euzebya tangerina]|uniref:cupin domain-containing protein n=1 Tax=Euzebya tangerina TaxID=591198 RepID=UPI000E30F4F3|nr:cupin domain-containing protein [Euzebya tangerina]